MRRFDTARRPSAALIMVVLLTMVVVLAVPAASAAAAPVPPVPEHPTEFASLVDTAGPNGVPGVWVWDPDGYFFRAPVEWRFVPARAVIQTDEFDAPPNWPADLLEVQAVVVVLDDGSPAGYWIWNPYRFVGGGDGPHFWSPNWEWHDPVEGF